MQLPHFTDPKKSIPNMSNMNLSVNGWSKEGLEKYNFIAHQVKVDRINLGEEFNAHYKSYLEEEESKKQAKKQKRVEVATYNDLNGSDVLHQQQEEAFLVTEIDEDDLLPVVAV
jgi:hypothetical protein